MTNEVFKCDFLANESMFQKEARKMFSQLETTDWNEHVFNNTIAKVFITFASSALPIETIEQAGAVINSLRFEEGSMSKHLDRLVKAKLLRKRRGTGLQRFQTMYEVNFKNGI